jgi:hypothetical protein
MHLKIKQKETRKQIYCFLNFIIILFLSFISYVASAQQNRSALTGFVSDNETKQPLLGASIRLLESSQGTTTNLEGAYRILLAPGSHQIAFSYIGFCSDTLDVQVDSIAVQRDVFLQPTTVNMPEVVVIGNKQDPAEEIILEAIARKHQILSQLQSYRFDAYTKTEARIKNPKKEKPDTIIAALFETQTSCSWKAPDLYKEVITARRQSANFMPEQNMFTVDKIPNLNDDIIALDRYSVIGPTAENALEYYTYKMVDTLAMDNYRVFRIRVTPKNNLKPLFDGIISIADKSYMVMQVDVRGNEILDLSPMIDVHLQQQFALFENKFWLPVESKLKFRIEISFPMVPEMNIEQYSLMHNYEINTELDGSLFDNFQIAVLPTADRVDTSYWQNVNMLPLTNEETAAYQQLDSLVTHAGFFSHAIMALANFSLPWKELKLTSFSDFFHFNRVEGAYLGAGLTTNELLPQSTITLRTGYAFAEKRGKYAVDIERYLSDRKIYSVGAGVYRKTSFREGEEFLSRGDITLLALLEKDDPVDYFEVTGWSLYSHVRPCASSSVEIRFLDEQHSSLTKTTDFSILYGSDKFRSNQPVIGGKLRSGSISFTYDTRKFLMSGMFDDYDRSQNSIWCTLKVEYSDKNILHGDFDFTCYSGSLNFYALTTSSGALRGNLRLGYAFGHVPPQRIFDLFGSTSDITPTGSLRTISIKEFAGDRLASLVLEHNFGSLPFRALGISFMKNMDLILFTGSAWSDLSIESRAIQPVPLQTCTKVINEIGFGLGRLFTLLRLDFAWRLTGNAKNDFTVTFGSSLW